VNQPVAAPDPTQLLSLNCFFLRLDANLNLIFTVKILKTKNVSILKDLIKLNLSPRLNQVDTSELILSQVSLLVDHDLEESLKNVDLAPLKPLLPLSQLFPRVEENRLHIVVQAPANGEPILTFLHVTDDLIDVGLGTEDAGEEERRDRIPALRRSVHFLPSLAILHKQSPCLPRSYARSKPMLVT